jgi:hypothetical protein
VYQSQWHNGRVHQICTLVEGFGLLGLDIAEGTLHLVVLLELLRKAKEGAVVTVTAELTQVSDVERSIRTNSLISAMNVGRHGTTGYEVVATAVECHLKMSFGLSTRMNINEAVKPLNTRPWKVEQPPAKRSGIWLDISKMSVSMTFFGLSRMRLSAASGSLSTKHNSAGIPSFVCQHLF